MSFSYIYFENNKVNDGFQKQSNPVIRMGHICVSYGKYLILWGGRRESTEQQSEEHTEKSKIWVFHTELEKWKSIQCAQDDNSPQQILSGSYSILVNDSVYLFGGSSKNLNSFTDTYHNDLYELDLKKLQWKKIRPFGDKLPSPRDKMSGWLHDNKLYFFGGFGPSFRNVYIDNYGDFDEISNFNSRLGWNNQLIYFELNTQTWHCQKYSNADSSMPVKPRAAHSCIKINDDKVVMFGGRTQTCRTNDLYVIDLKNFSCSKNLNDNQEASCPCPRSWHSMLKLNDKEVFIYGGLSQNNSALGDAWILSTINYQWTKIETQFEARLWHTASISDERKNEIYVLGGSFTDIYMNQPAFPEHILKINLAPETLKQLCINYISSNMELYELTIKKRVPYIPVDLEKTIFIKSSPNLKDMAGIYQRYNYRTEYCSIS